MSKATALDIPAFSALQHYVVLDLDSVAVERAERERTVRFGQEFAKLAQQRDRDGFAEAQAGLGVTAPLHAGERAAIPRRSTP